MVFLMGKDLRSGKMEAFTMETLLRGKEKVQVFVNFIMETHTVAYGSSNGELEAN